MGARKSKKSPIIEALEGFPGKEAFRGLGIDTQGEPFVPEHLMDDARGCIEVIKRSMPEGLLAAGQLSVSCVRDGLGDA